MIYSKQSLLVLCALTMVNGKIFCAADRQPDSTKRVKTTYTHSEKINGKPVSKVFALCLPSGTLSEDGKAINMYAKDHVEGDQRIIRFDPECPGFVFPDESLKIGDFRIDSKGKERHVFFIKKGNKELDWLELKQYYERLTEGEAGAPSIDMPKYEDELVTSGMLLLEYAVRAQEQALKEEAGR